jgi:hypothetical protein
MSNCGCQNAPIATVTLTTAGLVLPPCAEGEACEEILYSDCVPYQGANLPALGINNGDRLTTVLTKLHKKINSMMNTPIAVATYVATATTGTMLVRYLGLGPVYKSTVGATSSSTTVTVGSTTGLEIGMTVEVTAGTGQFAPNTLVLSITNSTSFIISQAPITPLSGTTTTLSGYGSEHKIFDISVVAGTPQSFKAFIGSPIKISGTGTIV